MDQKANQSCAQGEILPHRGSRGTVPLGDEFKELLRDGEEPVGEHKGGEELLLIRRERLEDQLVDGPVQSARAKQGHVGNRVH